MDHEAAQQAISRGHRAERALADATMTEAFAELRADLHMQWENCQAPVIRDGIWQQLNGVNAARGQLHAWVNEGKAAQARVEQEQRTAEAKAARGPLRLIPR